MKRALIALCIICTMLVTGCTEKQITACKNYNQAASWITDKIVNHDGDLTAEEAMELISTANEWFQGIECQTEIGKRIKPVVAMLDKHAEAGIRIAMRVNQAREDGISALDITGILLDVAGELYKKVDGTEV